MCIHKLDMEVSLPKRKWSSLLRETTKYLDNNTSEITFSSHLSREHTDTEQET